MGIRFICWKRLSIRRASRAAVTARRAGMTRVGRRVGAGMVGRGCRFRASGCSCVHCGGMRLRGCGVLMSTAALRRALEASRAEETALRRALDQAHESNQLLSERNEHWMQQTEAEQEARRREARERDRLRGGGRSTAPGTVEGACARGGAHGAVAGVAGQVQQGGSDGAPICGGAVRLDVGTPRCRGGHGGTGDGPRVPGMVVG